MTDALCRTPSIDPNIFFPKRGDIKMQRRAQRICAACPVAIPCLIHAVNNHERGVWGGTTELERRNIRITRRGNQ